MFDGKIDFMDFNKIKINYGGKLTCRKIFKKKYIIFLIVSVIILIVLISLYTVKNKDIITAEVDLKGFEEQKSQLESSYNLIKNKNQEEEMNLNKFKNQINVIRKDIYDVRNKEERAKMENKDIINQRDDLEKKSASLSVQLKTEYELKDVYDQKISSLTVLLDNLKIEYNKLIEQNGGENQDNSDIKSSKIVNSIEAFDIAKKIKGTIADKCFDGPENNYSTQTFHEKCDKSALLILIKTDDNKRLGAFIKVSVDGLEIKKDSDSCLINIDESKYFYVASTDYTTIVCDPNELPQIGIDLQIKKNGKALNMFPFHYGKSTDTINDFYKSNNIKIQNLEVYKVTM
jgi:hypothetical protein